jgi:hypothetical protein
MSLVDREHGIDVLNILVGKLSNSIVTASVFAFVSKNFGAGLFNSFGYWWSIGIMVGGVLLGGVGSATVRAVSVSRSLTPIFGFARHILVLNLFIAALLVATFLLFFPNEMARLRFSLAILGFGLSVLIQNVIFGLLRAIKDSRNNLVSSIFVIFQIPFTAWMLSGSHPSLTELFFSLAVAFFISAIVSILIAWRSVCLVVSANNPRVCSQRGFILDVISFTAINLFSYVAVNVDFTLIKVLSTAAEFSMLANGKIYFERFVLPVLMVIAGAISLRILRYDKRLPDGDGPLEFKNIYYCASIFFAVVVFVTIGYWIFNITIGSVDSRINLHWVAAASVGYILFAVNAVLFDLLAVHSTTRAVFIHAIVFMAVGAIIQLGMFHFFRMPGWATGWMVFNVIITARLIKLGVRMNRIQSFNWC